jgi:MFS family permease
LALGIPLRPGGNVTIAAGPFFLIYLLFFLSGISGLIYQVIWVRMFGNVFGNTIYSASIVVAVFMLGLGAGSYLVGAWADRRYSARPDSLLRAYGNVELLIAVMGLAIAAALPHLGTLSAAMSSYSREPSGWYALSFGSYLGRAAIAVILLTPSRPAGSRDWRATHCAALWDQHRWCRARLRAHRLRARACVGTVADAACRGAAERGGRRRGSFAFLTTEGPAKAGTYEQKEEESRRR